jgi:hypothetical protein
MQKITASMTKYFNPGEKNNNFCRADKKGSGPIDILSLYSIV